MANVKKFKARKFVPGKASGPALVTRERLMFFGFTDPKKGIFSAPQSELYGKSFKGAVVIYWAGRAGSGAPRGLDYCVRAGNSPAAIINIEIDPIAVYACALEDIPMVQVEDPSIFDQVKNGDTVTVDADKGEVVIIKKGGDIMT